MAEVFILLGGNMGDKTKIFCETRERLSIEIGVVVKCSSIYETEPWGFCSELFWNQALIIKTDLLPESILDKTQIIERAMGRVRNSSGYEARTMDIDLLFYDDYVINNPNLILPHPKMGERKFVLVPLNEIAGDKIHPVSGLSVTEMRDRCKDPLAVKRID